MPKNIFSYGRHIRTSFCPWRSQVHRYWMEHCLPLFFLFTLHILFFHIERTCLPLVWLWIVCVSSETKHLQRMSFSGVQSIKSAVARKSSLNCTQLLPFVSNLASLWLTRQWRGLQCILRALIEHELCETWKRPWPFKTTLLALYLLIVSVHELLVGFIFQLIITKAKHLSISDLWGLNSL